MTLNGESLLLCKISKKARTSDHTTSVNTELKVPATALRQENQTKPTRKKMVNISDGKKGKQNLELKSEFGRILE